MKLRQRVLFITAIAIGFFFVVIVVLPNREHRFGGSHFDPPVESPDFVLPDAEGNDIRLSDYKGQVVLMFFGYTSCPDICPATLSDFKAVRSALGERANQVRFFFITVDPERDTAERLRRYLDLFDPDIIGLTSSRQQLEPVWKAYGVSVIKTETEDPAAYFVDHSSRIYVIDKKGNLRVTYPFDTLPEVLAADIRYLLDEN